MQIHQLLVDFVFTDLLGVLELIVVVVSLIVRLRKGLKGGASSL